MSLRQPGLLHVRRHARNGFYPPTSFYGQAVTRQNHLMAYRKKQVVGFGYALGSETSGDGTFRWHCHTGYGTVRLVAYAVLSTSVSTVLGTDTPNVTITVTVPGGATSTFAPAIYTGGLGATGDADAPSDFTYHRLEVEVDANQTYEGLVTTAEDARLVSLCIFEESSGTVDEATDYYNEQTPQAGARIYDVHRQRLLQGLSKMWQRNGALQVNWALENGATRTRTSATAINLIDNTTTGDPSATSPGWKLDLAYRTTSSRAVVPCRFAVYAHATTTVTGLAPPSVRLVDTAGTIVCEIEIDSNTPQWWTGTADLVASAAKKYDPMFVSDGTNTLTVYAVSLYEYEA